MSAPATAEGERRPAGSEAIRRVTYLMLFRMVTVTLLLGGAIVVELLGGERQLPSLPALFAVVGLTYGLTIVWAILLRRAAQTRRDTVRTCLRLSQAQVATDLVVSTLLVHLTGGVDSGLVVLYLLVIVGASTALPSRATLVATGAAALLYLAVALGARLGIVPPWPGNAPAVLPWSAMGPSLRTAGLHLIALFATAILAGRLSRDLQRAGEELAQKGVELRDIATLHDDVVRSLTSGLLTLSDGGVLQSINPAGAEILGRDPDAVLGRPLSDTWPNIARALEGATSLHRGEVAINRPDGEARIIGLSASPLFNAAGDAVGRVVSFQDLSALKRMELQVERATRLAAIGRLAAGVAHEIRNPLAAISGSIELLRATHSAASDGEGRELWEIVEREVTRLNSLITDLLDFARPRAVTKVPLEVRDAVGEMVKMSAGDRRLGDGRLQLSAGDPLWIDGDPGQLRQVLWNLVRNAADATPDGAPIAISVGSENEGDSEWVKIAVRDRGPGIPEQHRARLFEPFFTTKKGGTGLGLALVHRIVEEHHGRLELANADGGGAVATVMLPRRSAP
jgi:two-component system sensor histidine kinase PilS (NtrC family)